MEHREIVGDAAGLVNPITGGGIALALRSGEIAGRVAAEAARGPARRAGGACARTHAASAGRPTTAGSPSWPAGDAASIAAAQWNSRLSTRGR